MSTEADEQQRILSEVSHDLANHFHRSYYFLELLGDAVPAEGGEDGPASLVSRLRATVEEIESLSRGVLDLMRPVDLRKLRVRVEDLTASLRQHVGMRTLEIRGDEVAGRCQVDVDPSRISSALACLCSVATRGDDSRDPLVVELTGGDDVALRIHRTGVAAKPSRSDLPLALIARIARLHGGDLEIGDGDAWTVTLRLPVASQGT